MVYCTRVDESLRRFGRRATNEHNTAFQLPYYRHKALLSTRQSSAGVRVPRFPRGAPYRRARGDGLHRGYLRASGGLEKPSQRAPRLQQLRKSPPFVGVRTLFHKGRLVKPIRSLLGLRVGLCMRGAWYRNLVPDHPELTFESVGRLAEALARRVAIGA
jgi:hypothetical protein